MPTVITQGQTRISVDDDRLRAKLKKIPDQVAESFKDRTATFLQGEILGPAISMWPVNTGFSRSSFRVIQEDSQSVISSQLANLADYAAFIRFGRESPFSGKLAWQMLIQDPAQKAENQLKEKLAQDFIEIGRQ